MPGDYDELFTHFAEQHPEIFETSRHDYFARLNNSSARSHGEPIKSFFHPYVLSREQYREIKTQAEIMAEIICKVGDLFFARGEVQEVFDFDPELLELMHVKPQYQVLIPIARYDGYYAPEEGRLQFCEFNGDGTSAMNETNTMEEIFLETEAGRIVKQQFDLHQNELRRSLFDVLLSNYRQSLADPAPNPSIAIMDWKESSSPEEFAALLDVFSAEGCPTMIVEPNDLRWDEGRLWSDDKPIDIVYRRTVTTELMERREEAADFLRAYRERAACTVGSLRTEIAHSKLIFCLLSDARFEKFFSTAERTFLSAHIPWTRRLTSADSLLLAQVLEERERLVLKPHNSYGSRGTIMGSRCTRSEWKDAVRRLVDTNYLVQKKILEPELKVITGPGLSTQNLKVNVGSYLYNQRLAGFYTRVSPIEIITTYQGGAVLPTFTAGA